MRIFGIQPSSLVNGPGLRCVVYLQGCKHNCPGCQNPGSHDPNGGSEVDIAYILREGHLYRTFLNGITLSGGEPFMQQEACIELLKAIPKDLDVLIFTGYTYEEIKDTELAKMAHYIIDGKFEADKRVFGWYGGSSNQRFIDKKKGIILSYDGTESELC